MFPFSIPIELALEIVAYLDYFDQISGAAKK